jgi:hypothetical protein
MCIHTLSLPSSSMTILAAPEPPRPTIKHRGSISYGGRLRGPLSTNPSSPFKSPLPSKDNEISPSSDNMSLINSPSAASSSQLSSPPPAPVRLDKIPSIPPWKPRADAEEDMEVEDPRTDAEEDEESEDESEDDDRPIVHSKYHLKSIATS